MRGLDTKYGRLGLGIPRDRNGSFDRQLIPDCARRADKLETTIITLYRKGITTREMVGLIEKLYGHHDSATTVSNSTESVQAQVATFHNRPLSQR